MIQDKETDYQLRRRTSHGVFMEESERLAGFHSSGTGTRTSNTTSQNSWSGLYVPKKYILPIIIAALTSVLVFGNVAIRTRHYSSSPEWWKTSIVYQIYIRSFQDSNGDGIGDLKGITTRLGYLKNLGVGAIWLTSFYKSPMRDFGYDVENHIQIDQQFGTMDDFEELMKEAKRKGLKVIIDFIPNHTSNDSVWFQKSRDNDPKYRDYYIWNGGLKCSSCADTNHRKPPNDWESLNWESSAWTYDSARKQFYYHAFSEFQPDLNIRNPAVQNELLNIMKFWLKKGVDGFRGNAVNMLLEAKDVYQNENDVKIFTRNLPEVLTILKQWKTLLNDNQQRTGDAKILIAECQGASENLRKQYYEAGVLPVNFAFTKKLKTSCNAKCIKKIIDNGIEEKSWVSLMTDFVLLRIDDAWWPNFVTGSHDVSRVGSRMGQGMTNVINMLLLTLPGTPTTYYGEEIGMVDTAYTYKESRDPVGLKHGKDYNLYSRDPYRSPMQWEESPNAGFSTSKPWLRVNDHYQTMNVQNQKNDPLSTLNVYKTLAKLRKNPAFTGKSLTIFSVDKNIISYLRSASKGSRYLVVLNFGMKKTSTDCSGYPIRANEGEVVACTDASNKVGNRTSLQKIELKRGQGIVIKIIEPEIIH